jgi:hypothetical protein
MANVIAQRLALGIPFEKTEPIFAGAHSMRLVVSSMKSKHGHTLGVGWTFGSADRRSDTCISIRWDLRIYSERA